MTANIARLSLAVLAALCLGQHCTWGASQPPGSSNTPARSGVYAPPRAVTVVDDTEDKAGTRLIVKWSPAKPGPLPAGIQLVGYQVVVSGPVKAPLLSRLLRRAPAAAHPSPAAWGEPEVKATTPPGETETTLDGLKPLQQYRVKVLALYADPQHPWYSPAAGKPVEAKATFGPAQRRIADSQGILDIQWQAPQLPKGPRQVDLVGYLVVAKPAAGTGTIRAKVGPDETETTLTDLSPGRPYEVRVAALYAPPKQDWYAPGEQVPVAAVAAASDETGPVSPVGLWFDPARTNILVGMVLYAIIVVLCFSYAQRGDMYIRPIAGLQAVDDAIGRATEMGRPLLYVSGLGTVGDISTIASMLVLGHLARRTAAYETPILVPCYDPLVMAADREIVREAYLEAGRPQAFRPENIFFVTDSQFGYVAAVDGVMVREKPAANFFVGFFYAESLILAETGNATGAIQIAATDADTQIPFFITACDYTLMGEELYAASAYLSRHPKLLAQLKGQDIGKAVMTVLLVLATALVTLQAFGLKHVAEWVLKLFAT